MTVGITILKLQSPRPTVLDTAASTSQDCQNTRLSTTMSIQCVMHGWALQELVLVRLSCLARVQDEKEYLQLRTSWDALKARERTILTDHFLADGIQDLGFGA